MIHIAIDTSGIGVGTKRSIKNASYQALQRLINAKQLTVHIPHVVKREIETQQLNYYLEEYNLLKNSLRKFLKVPKSAKVQKNFSDIQEIISNSEQSTNNDAQIFSSSWIKGLNAHIQEIDQQQALDALEAYFNGSPPLTSPKNREDIPDSFICRGFEEIKKNVDLLIIIADDKKIIKTFENLSGYKIFKNINDFIFDDDIQQQLKGLNVLENEITNLSQCITKYENLTLTLHNFLETHISDEIWNSTIHLDSYNGDDQATITTAYEGNSIEIDLENPIHYGNNLIGYNFSLHVEAEVEYFITHHDLYSHLDEDILMHMTNWNDYVSKISKIFELRVNGIVSIQISIEKIDPSIVSKSDVDSLQEYFSNIYEDSIINIESIEDIHIV